MGMQRGLLMFFVGEFSAFEIFMKMTVLQNLIFHIYTTGTSKIDHIWIEYEHILPFRDEPLFFYKGGYLFRKNIVHKL